MSEQPASIRTAFTEASKWFLAVVDAITPEQWSQPGLGEWTVRETVAHAARAFVTIEGYLDQPATIEIDSAGAYFALGLADPAVHRGVADRGRAAGAQLGNPTELHHLADRVNALVAGTDDARPIATPIGGLVFHEYLRTRVLELTVHTLDLIDALGKKGEQYDPPASAAKVTLDLLAEVAAARGPVNAGAAIRALAGRRPLPTGFNVLGPDVQR